MITSRNSRKSSGEGPSPPCDPSYAHTNTHTPSVHANTRSHIARSFARRVGVTPHHQPREKARAHRFKIHDAIAIATPPRTHARRIARARTHRANTSWRMRTSRRCRFMLAMTSSRARMYDDWNANEFRLKPHAATSSPADRDAGSTVHQRDDGERTDARVCVRGGV